MHTKSHTYEANGLVRGMIALAFFSIFLIWEMARNKFGLSLGFGRFVYVATSSAIILLMGNRTYHLLGSQNVLLDAGRHPHRWLILVSGGLSALAILGSGDVQRFWYGMRGYGAWFVLLDLVLPALALMLAFSRLQIRDDGLMIWTRFVPWRRIRCFHWENDDRLLLTSSFQLPLIKTLFVSTQAVAMVPDKKDAFDAALRQHLASGKT